jgi:hypothetical protein
MSWFISTLLNWLGSGVLDKVFSHLEARANSETERQRIGALRDQHMATVQGQVITAGMAHTCFWVVWCIAAGPLAFWFGWGMLGTAFPGYLPYVAIIPPGLEPWATRAWDSLFFSGGGVAGATAIARAIRR